MKWQIKSELDFTNPIGFGKFVFKYDFFFWAFECWFLVSSCSFGGSGSVDRISSVLIEVRAYFLIINFDYSRLYCIVDFFGFVLGLLMMKKSILVCGPFVFAWLLH